MNALFKMAVSGSQKDDLSKNLYSIQCHEESQMNSDDIGKILEESSYSSLKNKEEVEKENIRNMDDLVSCSTNDRTLSEVDKYVPDENDDDDDVNLSSDSLSSSASVSDSDLTSTDSDDSLALSESESITDVTPLNSPYCDSPIPQSKHIEYPPEDKNPSRDVDSAVSGGSHRPEVNVLMKAIEKLELEAKSNSELGNRDNVQQRKAPPFSNEETKKIEQENQRLLKRVISQQNRIRSIYSTSNASGTKAIPCRHQELVKSDGDISYNVLSLLR